MCAGTFQETSGSTTIRGSYLVSDGPTWNVGFGFDWWMSRRFTLGGRIVYQGTHFGEAGDLNYPFTNTAHCLAIAFIPSWHW